jgi:hypothetical protein
MQEFPRYLIRRQSGEKFFLPCEEVVRILASPEEAVLLGQIILEDFREDAISFEQREEIDRRVKTLHEEE